MLFFIFVLLHCLCLAFDKLKYSARVKREDILRNENFRFSFKRWFCNLFGSLIYGFFFFNISLLLTLVCRCLIVLIMCIPEPINCRGICSSFRKCKLFKNWKEGEPPFHYRRGWLQCQSMDDWETNLSNGQLIIAFVF